MGKAMLRVALVVAALVVLPLAARADLTLNYDGSLKLPRASIKDYYARGLAYVPNGAPRLGATPVTGPTLLVYYGWGAKTFEYGTLPALSTTAAQLAAASTAVEVPTTSGGTQYAKSKALQNVDSAGNIWDGVSTTSSLDSAMYSDPGTHKLGASSLSANYKVQETGWPGGYPRRGAMRLGDGAGGDLPSDGSVNGATFVMCQQIYSGPTYPIVVHDAVRTSATTVSSTELYRFDAGFWVADWQVNYVRDTSDAEYYMMWKEGGHAGDSFIIDFYDAVTTSGAGVTPTFQLDIGSDISGGAGWLAAGSKVSFVAVDWPNSQLYVLEHNGKDARVHLFTLQGPEAKPVAEPAGLGLLGLAALMGRKKRS